MSSAELVFGAALTLPGQFLGTMEQPLATYVKQLQDSPVLPTRPATYAEAAASVPEKLMKAEYVFVRRGSVVPPLAPLYHGPYKVLQAGDKFFTISLGGREDTVSVDRLKPHLGGPVVPEVVLHAVLPQWPLISRGPCWGGPLWRTHSDYSIVVVCM